MHFLTSGVVAGLFFASTGSAAIISTYENRADFESASGTLFVETFDSVLTDTSFNGADFSIGDMTLRNDNSGSEGFVDALPVNPVWSIDGTPLLRLVVRQDEMVRVSFSKPIFSFGADFWDLNNLGPRSQFRVLGEAIAPPLRGSGEIGFFGFISDMPFSEVEITNLDNGEGDGFTTDNVTYQVQVAAVPLPATAALLFAAVAGLASVRRARSE